MKEGALHARPQGSADDFSFLLMVLRTTFSAIRRWGIGIWMNTKIYDMVKRNRQAATANPDQSFWTLGDTFHWGIARWPTQIEGAR